MGGVGPVHVVVDSEVLDQDLGLEQRVELPAVEQLVSELAVERLDPGVLPWRAGIYEDRVDAVEPAPVRNRSGDELAAVVEADKRRAPWTAARQSNTSTTSSASMVRATLMARHSLVYSSMMFSILMVLPSLVTSNWKSSAHKTFGRMGDIAPTWVPVPVSRFLRLRCGTRRPSSRHRRRMRLSLTAQPPRRAALAARRQPHRGRSLEKARRNSRSCSSSTVRTGAASRWVDRC